MLTIIYGSDIITLGMCSHHQRKCAQITLMCCSQNCKVVLPLCGWAHFINANNYVHYECILHIICFYSYTDVLSIVVCCAYLNTQLYPHHFAVVLTLLYSRVHPTINVCSHYYTVVLILLCWHFYSIVLLKKKY